MASAEMTPRFGRRAQAQAALQAANQALADLPPTPDEFKQHAKTMERHAQAAQVKTQQQEEKADRLARQVQQLYADLQRKDRELSRLQAEKMQLDEKFRKAEVERLNAELGKGRGAEGTPLEGAIEALVMVADAGPTFEKQLNDFVRAKMDEKRVAELRKQMQAYNPFNQKEDKIPMKDKVMTRVRDVVYRKGVEIRRVFRQLDEDKTGHLDHQQFRVGLNKMGAYLSDEEWEVLLDVVDLNRDGKIQYIEFAETMKVNDVQMSFLAGPAPFAGAWHGKAQDQHDRKNLKGQIAIGGDVKFGEPERERTQVKEGYGLGMLPKHDILRRLAEAIELKHTNLGRAFMAYDKDKNGVLDKSEFRQMLGDMGILLGENDFNKLMKRIDKDDDGSVDLIEWWKQFYDEAKSGLPGAAGGIAGASWHLGNQAVKEARGIKKAHKHALDPFAD
jgi:Ca2+-binding EF-hand superfamily protein